jgi:hypothetical protein
MKSSTALNRCRIHNLSETRCDPNSAWVRSALSCQPDFESKRTCDYHLHKTSSHNDHQLWLFRGVMVIVSQGRSMS